MKSKILIKTSTFVVLVSLALVIFSSCSSSDRTFKSKSDKQDVPVAISSNILGTGSILELTFVKGKSHNHPTFVFWLEDMDGKYIQTLFISKAIGQGLFQYGDKTGGAWKPGEVRRPAALPYWAHKRGVMNESGSMVPTSKSKIPDAYSGATPKGSFVLTTRTDTPLTGKYRLMFEINQTWDWNEFWNNNKFPENTEYKTSCQPALVYSADIDFSGADADIDLKVLGHSHYAGEDGSLTTNVETLTTALQIAKEIKVKLINQKSN